MRRKPSIRCAALLVLLCQTLAGAAVAEPLQPPAGYRSAIPAARSTAALCEAPPVPYTGVLEFQSKYEGSGPARDSTNPASAAAYKRKTLPIVSMEKGTVALVKHYRRTGQQADADCALRWLLTWADARALTAEASNHTGRSLRKWSLGTLASAYLQLKFAPSQPLAVHTAQAQRIERWLAGLALQVAAEWPPTDPIPKINNHYYWSAWALMAAAVATDQRASFEAALALYRVFERQAEFDGVLPNELKRASRAAEYHNYAMAPLAMVAAFAKANGVLLAEGESPALVRLARQAEHALDNPQTFAARAGASQESKALGEQSANAWLEPYCWVRVCSSSQQARLAVRKPLASTRLGGDLTAVFASAPDAARVAAGSR